MAWLNTEKVKINKSKLHMYFVESYVQHFLGSTQEWRLLKKKISMPLDYCLCFLLLPH